MSVWFRIAEFIAQAPVSALSSVIETLRTFFEGDPATRRRVAFSIAMIALSAKMARADGIVTPDEVRAFHQLFEVPESELRNVDRLFQLAQQDVAGYEHYAERLAGLCGSGQPNCAVLEDILDGLFHIAKADGVVHERELAFLQRVSEKFSIDEAHFEQIASRHTVLGAGNPYLVLGLEAATPFAEVRRRYRKLVAENHPDRLIARGVPEEFVSIANARLAAINGAYEAIERNARAA